MGECVFLKRRRPVKVSCPEEKKKKKKIVSPPEKEACAFWTKEEGGKKNLPTVHCKLHRALSRLEYSPIESAVPLKYGCNRRSLQQGETFSFWPSTTHIFFLAFFVGGQDVRLVACKPRAI
jgi:hypothetical protein